MNRFIFFPLVILLCVSSANADSTKFSGQFSTLLHLQNDRDFDRSVSAFDPQGQWLGQVGSFGRGKLEYAASINTTLVYELLLGWHTWGRDDPNQPNPFSPSRNRQLMARHQQLYANWHAEELSLKMGFIQHQDPSEMLIAQAVGGVELRRGNDAHGGHFFVGQLPESTFEGWDAGEDNFTTDSFLWGVSSWFTAGDIKIDTALYGFYDERYLNRPLVVHTGIVGLTKKDERLSVAAFILGQYGQRQNGNLGGTDETLQGYAGRTEIAYRWGRKGHGQRLKLGGLWLSPDSGLPGDGTTSSFFWSGKSNSASIWLSENERQDRYDNLDERWAGTYGPFVRHSAGYQLIDLAFTQGFGEVHTTVSIAHAMNLNPDFRGGHRAMGTEYTAIFDWNFAPGWGLAFDGFVLVPESGGSYGYNGIDQTATELVWGTQMGLSVSL